jgi:hypothetical protein
MAAATPTAPLTVGHARMSAMPCQVTIGMDQMLLNVNLVALTNMGPEAAFTGPAFQKIFATPFLLIADRH